MKFSHIVFATVAALVATNYSDAFTNPKVTPVSPGNAVDVDNAMSQYEAALRAAFEQASPTAVPSPANQQQEAPTLWSNTQAAIDANEALLEQVVEQEKAIDDYGIALKAALESSPSTEEAPPTIVFGEEAAIPQAAQVPQPDWDVISDDISARIEKAESILGSPLDAAAKGEIVGTVLAGSAALAINSPLLMGAALGYAGTHVLGGKRGEELAEASKEALTNAMTFTQAQIENEQGDLSKAGARIVEHIQNEAIRKSREVQKAAEIQAHQVSRELSNVPAHMMEEGKKMVQSEDFTQMPKRTFKAVTAFLGSDEVKRARERVVKAVQDSLESEELQAVKDRASRSLKDI